MGRKKSKFKQLGILEDNISRSNYAGIDKDQGTCLSIMAAVT